MAKHSPEQVAACMPDDYYTMLIAQTPVAWPLFFPESGFFPIFYQEPSCITKFACAFGLPIDLNWVIFMAPKSTKPTYPGLDAHLDEMHRWSFGNRSTSNLVVVPVSPNDDERLAKFLVASRELNENERMLYEERRKMVIQMRESTGMRLKTLTNGIIVSD